MNLIFVALALSFVVSPVGWTPVPDYPGAFRPVTPADGTVGLLDQGNNEVLMAHNWGAFKMLSRVNVGDEIIFNGANYVVTQRITVRDRGVSLEQQKQNGTWIYETDSPRLTLVTCTGPKDEYRLIVVAQPVGE